MKGQNQLRQLRVGSAALPTLTLLLHLLCLTLKADDTSSLESRFSLAMSHYFKDQFLVRSDLYDARRTRGYVEVRELGLPAVPLLRERLRNYSCPQLFGRLLLNDILEAVPFDEATIENRNSRKNYLADQSFEQDGIWDHHGTAVQPIQIRLHGDRALLLPPGDGVSQIVDFVPGSVRVLHFSIQVHLPLGAASCEGSVQFTWYDNDAFVKEETCEFSLNENLDRWTGILQDPLLVPEGSGALRVKIINESGIPGPALVVDYAVLEEHDRPEEALCEAERNERMKTFKASFEYLLEEIDRKILSAERIRHKLPSGQTIWIQDKKLAAHVVIAEAIMLKAWRDFLEVSNRNVKESLKKLLRISEEIAEPANAEEALHPVLLEHGDVVTALYLDVAVSRDFNEIYANVSGDLNQSAFSWFAFPAADVREFLASVDAVGLEQAIHQFREQTGVPSEQHPSH